MSSAQKMFFLSSLEKKRGRWIILVTNFQNSVNRKSRKPSWPNTWNSRPTWPLLSTVSNPLPVPALLPQLSQPCCPSPSQSLCPYSTQPGCPWQLRWGRAAPRKVGRKVCEACKWLSPAPQKAAYQGLKHWPKLAMTAGAA